MNMAVIIKRTIYLQIKFRMKIKLFLSIVLTVFAIEAYSQVGIGNTTPAATLDVTATATDKSTAEGFVGPRLTGNQLTAKNAQYGTDQNATIVYITEAATATTGKTKNVKTPGYYFYDAGAESSSGLWVPFTDNSKEQFYIPTILLPTDSYTLPDSENYSYANTKFSVNLYNIYKSQLDTPKAVSSPTASLQTGTTASDFNYFVLYYDTSVFTGVTISAAGVLAYGLSAGYTLSDKTFMSIVIREK